MWRRSAAGSPRGPYEATYQELDSKLREIHQACEANGGSPPPNLLARLEELKQLAAKLPGEVTVVPRSSQDELAVSNPDGLFRAARRQNVRKVYGQLHFLNECTHACFPGRCG